jgi:hypothetical protein
MISSAASFNWYGRNSLQDAPEKMAAHKKAAGYLFPYLFDADQSVAKAERWL